MNHSRKDLINTSQAKLSREKFSYISFYMFQESNTTFIRKANGKLTDRKPKVTKTKEPKLTNP